MSLWIFLAIFCLFGVCCLFFGFSLRSRGDDPAKLLFLFCVSLIFGELIINDFKNKEKDLDFSPASVRGLVKVESVSGDKAIMRDGNGSTRFLVLSATNSVVAGKYYANAGGWLVEVVLPSPVAEVSTNKGDL